MLHRLTHWLAGAAVAAVTATSLSLVPPPALAAPRASAVTAVPAYTPPSGVTDPCQASSAGTAGCAVLTGTAVGHRAAGLPAVGTTPTGYTPANLASAYRLPSTMPTGSKVAVVTAYDDPNAATDLGTYRTQYGLAACTTASGCFQKVNQTGGTTYPKASAGWSAGAAESVDMISAICSACDIILVEASSSAITDLGAAENEAVALGAKFIDNDWTIPEAAIGSAETTNDTEYFNHPGVAITAPAGDGGYGVSYPAASPYVTAVGGTTLTADIGVIRGWNESTWTGTGSGCSTVEPKPAWQSDTGCTGRTDNDAAAVADPSTPVAYYDTPTAGGWGTGSGTALSAAIIAAAYALAGFPAPGSNPASYLYTHPAALHAITSGPDGTCAVAYLCPPGTRHNGPAGMGTPYADTAFHTVGARPSAISAKNGTTWVFVLGSSGAIEESSRPSGSSTWSSLTSLGGTWSGYPSALAASDGSVWVFARSGGNLYADQLPSGSTTWSGWTEIGNPGDSLTAAHHGPGEERKHRRIHPRRGNGQPLRGPAGRRDRHLVRLHQFRRHAAERCRRGGRRGRVAVHDGCQQQLGAVLRRAAAERFLVRMDAGQQHTGHRHPEDHPGRGWHRPRLRAAGLERSPAGEHAAQRNLHLVRVRQPWRQHDQRRRRLGRHRWHGVRVRDRRRNV